MILLLLCFLVTSAKYKSLIGNIIMIQLIYKVNTSCFLLRHGYNYGLVTYHIKNVIHKIICSGHHIVWTLVRGNLEIIKYSLSEKQQQIMTINHDPCRIYTNLFYVEAKTTTPLNLPENRGHYHFVLIVDWLIHF